MEVIFKKLQQPFDEKELSWRVQSSGIKNNKPWARVLVYVTNRAIMDRLDDVIGPEKWQNIFQPWHNGAVCGLSLFLCVKQGMIDDWQWITKFDGADDTDIESTKGGLSSAMKRSAVQFGIGRYLYHVGDSFADFTPKGKYSAKIDGKYYKWNPPKLDPVFLPTPESRILKAQDEFEKAVDEACEVTGGKVTSNDEPLLTTNYKFLQLMEKMKKDVGEDVYYSIISTATASNGTFATKANEVYSKGEQTKVYNAFVKHLDKEE